MNTFIIISFPMFAVGLALMFGCYKTKNKNYLVPGFTMITAGIYQCGDRLELKLRPERRLGAPTFHEQRSLAERVYRDQG